QDGDAVVLDVAQPAHRRGRLQFDARVDDTQVVPLARPHQGAVRPEADGLVVMVGGQMGDAFACHEAVYSGGVRWCGSQPARCPQSPAPSGLETNRSSPRLCDKNRAINWPLTLLPA